MAQVFYDSISEFLNRFEIDSGFPYYITTGNSPAFYPKEAFGLDYYTLGVCLEGSAELELNGEEHLIIENTILVGSPSTVVLFRSYSENYRAKHLFFDKDFLLKNVADPFLVERIGFFKEKSFITFEATEDSVLPVLDLFTSLENRVMSGGKFKDDIIRTTIFLLLLEAAELLPLSSAEPSLPKDLYFRFVNLVQENIPEQTQLAFYQEQLHVSDKYLIELVKESSGKTPHHIIDEMMLKKAFVLLNSPALNITDIAYQLNFSSVSTFSRFFKNQTGFSPSEYQKKTNK